ncbi:MAG: hypothetical protein SFX18_11050 [Pirellulales bacterium]|nr:hypothetical protein [Pirellulales bacterium]
MVKEIHDVPFSGGIKQSAGLLGSEERELRLQAEFIRQLSIVFPVLARALYVQVDSQRQELTLAGRLPTFYIKQLLYRFCSRQLPEYRLIDRLQVDQHSNWPLS